MKTVYVTSHSKYPISLIEIFKCKHINHPVKQIMDLWKISPFFNIGLNEWELYDVVDAYYKAVNDFMFLKDDELQIEWLNAQKECMQNGATILSLQQLKTSMFECQNKRTPPQNTMEVA